MSNFSESDDTIEFIEDEANSEKPNQDTWCVLIVDDEPNVHEVTKLALTDYDFDNKKISFLSAFSSAEAKKIFRKNSDIAVVLLDVVMEKKNSGLQFVKFIREELKNDIVRITIRTGQPGEAPEDSVVEKYEINDYKIKSEITSKRLKSLMTLALKSYIENTNWNQSNSLLKTTVAHKTNELKISEDRYRLLVELSPDGILVHLDYTILFANNAAVKTLGALESKELIGKSINDFIHPKYQEIVRNSIKKLQEEGLQTTPLEQKLIRLDKKIVIVEVSSAIIRYQNKSAVLSIIRDISERKKIEKLQMDTEHLMQHDLKNLLTPIIPYSQMLLEKALDKEALKYASYIYDSANKLQQLVNNSLDLFKMEAGTFSLNLKEFNLISILDNLNQGFYVIQKAKSLQIDYFLNNSKLSWTDSYPIFGEKIYINNLLANLIINALEASPENSKITISIKSTDNLHQINIHNIGVIPESIRDQFFERYVTSGKRFGTGIGTYSAMLIAKTHGGDISFSTSEAEGTYLNIVLPKMTKI